MNILIIRLSSLGDIVLTQSAVQAIRIKFPDAKIHYLTKRAFVPIVEMFNCVDEIHYWEKKYSVLIDLKKIHFDIAIDLHAKFNTFIIKRYVNAKRTVTYNKNHFLRRRIVKHKTNKTISSTVELYFSTLRKLGLDTEFSAPKLFPVTDTIMPDLFPSNKVVNYIGVFPGALHKTKQYPIKQLAEFIDYVPSAWNCKFLIFGSESEVDLADILNSLTKSTILNLCGKLNLQQLVTAIDRMDVLITNDSGPMHIAAALKKPQITIFGSTHPKLGFTPMNENAMILSADLECQPCSLHGGDRCPLGHFNCMRSISPKQILDSLNSLLIRNA